MPRNLKEAVISTRNARSRLRPGIHWRAIDPDVHLGYRRGARGGKWLVRWYHGDGVYRQETFATADDALDADGLIALSFDQAIRRARDFVCERRAEEHERSLGAPLTVSSVILAYLAARESREMSHTGKLARRDARSRLSRYVLQAPIEAKVLASLQETDLQDWLASLPDALALSTIRRLVGDFKAALNMAGRVHRARLPAHFPIIVRNGLATPGGQPPEARKQILSDADVRRIVAATWEIDAEREMDGDLARLIIVLAATGARFSQIAEMKVFDVQSAERRLMVPVSRKGRGSKSIDRIGVRVGDDVLEALRPAMAGRRGPDPLLERWRHKQVGPAVWVRDRRGPWLAASELSRLWASILVRAGLPADTVPYALRHSAIVRGLRAGLPIRLVAALHDTSSAMIERHYSAYIVDALDELAAKAVVPLTTAPG